MRDLGATQPAQMKPPFERSTDFIQKHGDVFLAAKVGGYGAIIHTGRLSWWSSNSGSLAGYSGGALSAFWTPETGSVVLGKARGFASKTKDTWTDWQLWPTHHIAGVDSAGAAFSSGRQKSVTRRHDVSATEATVDCSGSLADGAADPNDALTDGTVDYSRKFEVKSSGLKITSTVTSTGTDQAAELYEIIPIFHGDTKAQAATIQDATPSISLKIDGSWVSPKTSLQTGVTAIRIQRFSGTVYIEFASSEAVKLSPQGVAQRLPDPHQGPQPHDRSAWQQRASHPVAGLDQHQLHLQADALDSGERSCGGGEGGSGRPFRTLRYKVLRWNTTTHAVRNMILTSSHQLLCSMYHRSSCAL